MTLALTAVDRARFEAAAEALLSPGDSSDSANGFHNTLDRLVELFAVDRVAFFLPEEDRVRIIARGFDDDQLRTLTKPYRCAAAGTNEYTYPKFARMMACLHERDMKVYTYALAERLSGIRRVDQPYYHEVARPLGVQHHVSAAVSLPKGKALLGISYDDPERGRFASNRAAVLRLLYPAIESGVRARWELRRRRATLEGALDCLTDGVMICDAEGRELHRNKTLRRFLAEDSQSNALLTRIHRMAEHLAGLGRKNGKAERAQLPVPGSREIKTSSSRYNARASFLGPGLFATGGSIQVTLERRRPELPSAEELRQRFGLTPREVEVALLLARGRSNAEIADRIGRSRHTVRHHIEHIFRKMGIRSRKAVALRMLGGDAG